MAFKVIGGKAARVVRQVVEAYLTSDAAKTSCALIYQPKVPEELKTTKDKMTDDVKNRKATKC